MIIKLSQSEIEEIVREYLLQCGIKLKRSDDKVVPAIFYDDGDIINRVELEYEVNEVDPVIR